MNSTRDVVGVGPDAVAESIVAKMLSARDSLPHAANGSPIAPSNPAAAQVRKDMRQGVSREWARALKVSICDATDGADVELVKAPYSWRSRRSSRQPGSAPSAPFW